MKHISVFPHEGRETRQLLSLVCAVETYMPRGSLADSIVALTLMEMGERAR